MIQDVMRLLDVLGGYGYRYAASP